MKTAILFLISLLNILTEHAFSASTFREPDSTPKSTLGPSTGPSVPHLEEQVEKRTVQSCTPSPDIVLQCTERAKPVNGPIPDLASEVSFFKMCIADYYCFVSATDRNDAWASLPNFNGVIGSPYFNDAAKKVKRFFTRNNDWDNIKANSLLRNSATGECTNLLQVIAARHLYSVFVLYTLSGSRTFGPCMLDPAGSGKLAVPTNGECYPAHHGITTCTSDHDIALIGERSGTLAALYERHFREPAGTDESVPGFGKSPEDVMNSNVYAATLQAAMPGNYVSLSADFLAQMNVLNTNIEFNIQEIVCGISKMMTYHSGYYNDLHSDHVELRHQPTRHNLFSVYQQWNNKYLQLIRGVKTYFEGDALKTEVGFRRRVFMVYEYGLGKFEHQRLPPHIAKVLAEITVALVHGADTYNTRGATRHVVGWTQMKNVQIGNNLKITDFWVSMLENWADTIKEFKRECKPHGLSAMACLPKLAKYMWRMFDAKVAIYARLRAELKTGLLVFDTLRSIMAAWLTEIKNKGISEIPASHTIAGIQPVTTSINYFLQAFKCGSQQPQGVFSEDCLDKIHEVVREYNRNLFRHIVYSDPK